MKIKLTYVFHYYRDWYNPKKKDRLLIEIASGYGIPLIISFLTLIVEISSPRCAIYKPRFGEETCFFSGKAFNNTIYKIEYKVFQYSKKHRWICFDVVSDTTSKGIWFFLPLGILLLINLFMFISIVFKMLRLEGKENMSNTKKMKKLVIYLLISEVAIS